MTPISPRDPDGSLALNSGALPTPAKAPKKPSSALTALTASVVTAATLALAPAVDAQARTQTSSAQTVAASTVGGAKNTKKKLKKSKRKKNVSFQMGSQGWATLQSRTSGYSNVNYSASQIAPIGGIAANNMPTVPLGASNTRVTAAEQQQRATTLAKIERIRTRPISYADLKKLVNVDLKELAKTLDERDRLATVFPIWSTLSYPNSTEKLAIGEMLQVMLYDPDPKLHANPKDALSNFKRFSMVTGQLVTAERIKNTYFEKGSPEYVAMTAILIDTRRISEMAAVARGLPVTPARELPFTQDLPSLKPESLSLQYIPEGADFRTPSYRGQRANLPKVQSTPVRDAAGVVWLVPPAVITPPAPAPIAPPVAVKIAPPAPKPAPAIVPPVVITPPAPAVVIPAPIAATAPVAKASVPRAESSVSSTQKPIANRAQLTLPGVEKAPPRTARVKSVDAPQAKVLSQHAEAFSKLPPTVVLTDGQEMDILHPNFLDRSHVIIDFLTRPRLTKVGDKLVVTNTGDLSAEKARELAVSDNDRALYIAGALEMLIAWKNPVDKAFLGRTSVLEAFQKILTKVQPPQGETRAQMRSHIELSLMILYASGNPKNIVFAESALKTLKTELTDSYLQNLASSLTGVADRPMATVNWVPGRLRTVVNYNRASTPQKN
jgi:hypothetical protein